MTELEVKLVKVDNWGIFFLQRLKHFFNRTDYCDLTLQFQDNAQLKVHRLVLSACTEYFELLERTCEMYEDCLVMPDDLQADVVVPIVNFMYTGQLEFRMDLLERLYQTSQIMNMPVLTKLLDAHRGQAILKQPVTYNTKKSYSKPKESALKAKQAQVAASSSKRAYTKAFGNTVTPQKEIKKPSIISEPSTNNGVPIPYHSPIFNQSSSNSRKVTLRDPRPTRYELPEELDTDNIFDSSFTNISYTSQPLMVHPETTKQYQRKKVGLFGEPSASRKLGGGTSTLDIVECKQVTKKENIFEDDSSEIASDLEMFQMKDHMGPNVSNQLFDQIIDDPVGPKVTIETKDAKQAGNIDHAKIISEVLKKYPHLVKGNKNIKLKILNTPSTSTQSKLKPKKQRHSPTPYHQEKETRQNSEALIDTTYETDVLDSKEAARLIAMGAENVKGPWICLICGTPGKALHFTTYYKFRRHLVEVHKEKPVSNMCEYCGLRSLKRNYLLHHLYTKHNVEPPPQYHFPKCNVCNYIALTEGLLVKHKATHNDTRSFRCNVCPATFHTSNQLLAHIQATGHKFCADKKTNVQCVYCQKVFSREGNLYAHLKTYHKQSAKNDGIIDDSDDENSKEENTTIIKFEPPSYEAEYSNNDDIETQYQILPDGNIELLPKNRHTINTPKQKILNSGFDLPVEKPVQKTKQKLPVRNIVPVQEECKDEIVMIDNNEYIMRNNQLIPRKKGGKQFNIIPDIVRPEMNETLAQSTSLDFSNIQDTMVEENLNDQKMMIKNTANMNQSFQIVVSNEEEYKALMNSNHSIIFDDGNTNKTLTVLSTPQNATMNSAALDLESVQSNNMMILPDNYPIGVSDAMPGDNSNIVVVYSHAVDEQNKQFQIISSQDIGPQFVQSSAVITQNYMTSSTTAPAMAEAQVIHTQVAESWQDNAQNCQRHEELIELQDMAIVQPTQITVAEQEMAIVEDAQITSVEQTSMDPMEIMSQEDEVSVEQTQIIPAEPEPADAISELPEVTLTETSQVSSEVTEVNETEVTEVNETEVNETEVIVQQSNEIIANESLSEAPAAVCEDIVSTDEPRDNASLAPMDVDVSTASAAESPEDGVECATEVTYTEPPAQNPENIEIEQSTTDGQKVEDQAETVEYSPENNVEHVSHNQIDTNDENQAPESTENETADLEEDTPTEQSNNNTVTEEVSSTLIPEENKEKIQSLASEWSEDEYDTEEQVQHKDGQDNVLEKEATEMEESIENIQQEMEKQVNDISETGDTEESVNQNLGNNQEQAASELPVQASQEKISSLLNDWEETDSQGNDSTNGTEDEPAPVAANKEPDTSEPEKAETKKVVKIQNLVSDWDDDEEETSKN